MNWSVARDGCGSGLPKRNVVDEARIPSAKGRLYAVTGNSISPGTKNWHI
jgi:hypothetical protein